MGKLRIGLIFGGESPEHEVSLASASAIYRSLDPQRYLVVPIAITKDGRWIGGEPARRALAEGSTDSLDTEALRSVAGHNRNPLISEEVDIVIPALHGPYGEDGTIQGFLELCGVPYVGSGVLSSAVGMDKVIMKSLFEQAGLPVVPSVSLLTKDWIADPAGAVGQIVKAIGFPCFIKPANQGSSVGISSASSEEELRRALDLAVRYDRKLIVERGIDAREIEVAVLGNDQPEASVAGEIRTGHKFYDYEAKYTAGEMELIAPAPVPDEQMELFRTMAMQAFVALDCSGMARVDFFLDRRDEKIYVNEINTIPGFTELSIYPKLWEASGLSYRQLLDRLIELALERFSEKRDPAGLANPKRALSIPFQWC